MIQFKLMQGQFICSYILFQIFHWLAFKHSVDFLKYKARDVLNPKETEGGRNQDTACFRPPLVQ